MTTIDIMGPRPEEILHPEGLAHKSDLFDDLPSSVLRIVGDPQNLPDSAWQLVNVLEEELPKPKQETVQMQLNYYAQSQLPGKGSSVSLDTVIEREDKVVSVADALEQAFLDRLSVAVKQVKQEVSPSKDRALEEDLHAGRLQKLFNKLRGRHDTDDHNTTTQEQAQQDARVEDAAKKAARLLSKYRNNPEGMLIRSLDHEDLVAAAEKHQDSQSTSSVENTSARKGETRKERTQRYKEQKAQQPDKSAVTESKHNQKDTKRQRHKAERAKNRNRKERAVSHSDTKSSSREASSNRETDLKDNVLELFSKYSATTQNITKARVDGTHEVVRSEIMKRNNYQSIFARIMSNMDTVDEQDQLTRDIYDDIAGLPNRDAQEYVSFAKGAIVETIVGEELQTAVSEIDLPGFSLSFIPSTQRQDIDEGYDYVVRVTNKQTGSSHELYFDAKSAGMFGQMMEKNVSVQITNHIGETIKGDRSVTIVNPLGSYREEGQSITQFNSVGGSEDHRIPSFRRNTDNVAAFQKVLQKLIQQKAERIIGQSGRQQHRDLVSA